MRLTSGYVSSSNKTNSTEEKKRVARVSELSATISLIAMTFQLNMQWSETNSVPHRLQILTGRVSTTEEEVRRVLQNISPSKAAGPDRVSPRLLTLCAEQLPYNCLLFLICVFVLTQSLRVGNLHCPGAEESLPSTPWTTFVQSRWRQQLWKCARQWF